MAPFNNLQDAGASQDNDQFAIARGAGTFRQTIGRILAAVRGANTLPAATARADSSAHKREWLNRIEAARAPTIHDQSADYAIVASDIGSTVRLTGGVNRTFSLPDIAGDVSVGALLYVVNDSTAVLRLDGHGDDTIDGRINIDLRPGEAVTIQAVSVSAWDLISDTTSGEPQIWSAIPQGSFVRPGQIVIHNSVYYGCITAHARSAIGPNADRANWSLLGTTPAQVRSYNANTVVTAAQRGWTFRATGATTRLLSIPNASGAGEVVDGWEFVAANASSVNQTVSPNGTDQIGGSGALTLAPGRAVRLQKVATGVWLVIADTKDERGTGTAFAPTKANLYDAVKAIFLHNTAVTADDANNELDFASGAAGALADNSIAPIKALAALASNKKDWRARLGSSSIGLVASALPAVASHNAGDTVIVARGGTTVVPFREVDEPSTELTDTVAGDVMMLLAAGWTRIGNLFSGGIAAAAARTIADANAAVVGRLPIFGRISVNPAGIPDAVPPAFITLTLDSKLTDRTITRIQCSIEGQNFANIVRNTSPTPPATDHAAPFNQAFNAGGVINGSFTPTQLDNLATQAGLVASRAAQTLQGQIRYSFTDGADQIDYFEWGVQNNGFRPLVVDNIASFNAAANRFEDLSNNRILIPEGATVYLTQAIYDAAVADAQFTPNPKATFITPGAIYYGGQRYGRQRERFERAVGASPATLPVGTYDLAVNATPRQTTDYIPKRIALSDLATTDRRFVFRGLDGHELFLTMRYSPTARTLTYSIPTGGPNGRGTATIKAIGES